MRTRRCCGRIRSCSRHLPNANCAWPHRPSRGMEILWYPAEGRPAPSRRLVDGPPVARDPADGDRDGRPRRRHATQRFSGLSARVLPARSACCFRCSARFIRRSARTSGNRTAAWLYDWLTEACVCPPGLGRLEDPALTSDLTVALDTVIRTGLHLGAGGRAFKSPRPDQLNQ